MSNWLENNTSYNWSFRIHDYDENTVTKIRKLAQEKGFLIRIGKSKNKSTKDSHIYGLIKFIYPQMSHLMDMFNKEYNISATWEIVGKDWVPRCIFMQDNYDMLFSTDYYGAERREQQSI